MSCCCTKVYRLCDVIVCEDTHIRIPIPVSASGLYTLELDFLGKVIRIPAAQEAGAQEMTFPTGLLNEAYTYTAQVRDPADYVVPFTVDEVEYDCISFTTKRELAWTNTSSESSASSPA